MGRQPAVTAVIWQSPDVVDSALYFFSSGWRTFAVDFELQEIPLPERPCEDLTLLPFAHVGI